MNFSIYYKNDFDLLRVSVCVCNELDMVVWYLLRHTLDFCNQQRSSKETASFSRGVVEAEGESRECGVGEGAEEGVVAHSPNGSCHQRRSEQGQVQLPQTALAKGPSRSPR